MQLHQCQLQLPDKLLPKSSLLKIRIILDRSDRRPAFIIILKYKVAIREVEDTMATGPVTSSVTIVAELVEGIMEGFRNSGVIDDNNPRY